MATLATLIANAEARATAAQARFDACHLEQRSLLDDAPGDTLDEAAQARFDELTTDKRSAKDDLDAATAKVADLRKQAEDDARIERGQQEQHDHAERQAPAARIGKEERTYTAGNAWNQSFFRDMFVGQFNGDARAADRIQRHLREAEVDGQLSVRAGTTSGFAGLVPPQYLVDQAAALARAGRPTADSVQHLELPDEGMSLVVPRVTTGVTTAVQATENAAVSNTDAAVTNLTIPVVTIAGQQVLSRQAIERGQGIDQLIYNDLVQAYNVALDQQVLSGTGSSGQMLGILNTSGTYQASAYTAAATVATFYPKLLGAINAVETGRYLAPNLIIMHPRRFNWLLAQVDSSGRPLAVPNLNGPMNAVGIADTPQDTALARPAGWIAGVPVVTDANIPTSVGTGPEDQIIVAHKEDLLLWENGDGAPFQLRFDQPLGNQLSVVLVAYNYAAFTAGRYPSAVAIIGGNAGAGFGQVAPTF